jgi:hypothetical protein
VHALLEGPLSSRFEKAKDQIYKAMREGRLFVSHDNLAPGKGFRFHFTSESGSSLNMGGSTSYEPGVLDIITPLQGEIRLIHNGALMKKWRLQRVCFPLEKRGSYRVEVFLKCFPFGWRPWIFSNPIYLV